MTDDEKRIYPSDDQAVWLALGHRIDGVANVHPGGMAWLCPRCEHELRWSATIAERFTCTPDAP